MTLIEEVRHNVVLAQNGFEGNINHCLPSNASKHLSGGLHQRHIAFLEAFRDCVKRAHFLSLPYEIRRLIFGFMVTQIQIHCCVSQWEAHHWTEPTCPTYACIPNAASFLVRLSSGVGKAIPVYLIAYSIDEHSRGKLPKDWLVRPALICRQLREEWLAFLREAPFRILAFDAFCLPFLLPNHPCWLRKQIRNIGHLQYIISDGLQELRLGEATPEQLGLRQELGIDAFSLISNSVDSIRREFRSLKRLTVSIDNRVLEFGGTDGRWDPPFGRVWNRELAKLRNMKLDVYVRILKDGYLETPCIDQKQKKRIFRLTGNETTYHLKKSLGWTEWINGRVLSIKNCKGHKGMLSVGDLAP